MIRIREKQKEQTQQQKFASLNFETPTRSGAGIIFKDPRGTVSPNIRFN